MKPETIDTVIRHLKGIVAALEKEKGPQVVTYIGKPLDECSDKELVDAAQICLKSFDTFKSEPVIKELRVRGYEIGAEIDNGSKQVNYFITLVS